MIAREVGVDPAKINYVPFRGGGEATAAILGGNVTVGGSGYSEFAAVHRARQDARDRRHRAGARLKGINVPTLKEQGINVEIGNWRGVYGAPGITPDAAQGADRHGAQGASRRRRGPRRWRRTTGRRRVLAGKEFEEFVDKRLREPARDDGQGRHGLSPRPHVGPTRRARRRALRAPASSPSTEAAPCRRGCNHAPLRSRSRRSSAPARSSSAPCWRGARRRSRRGRLCRRRAQLPALARVGGAAAVRRAAAAGGAHRRLSRAGRAVGRASARLGRASPGCRPACCSTRR